ncbi:MAG: hypothetical protein CMI57_00765 [Parcubacteria group bacterium]|jgi:hypothetical protein|nr:hypothetical protein [Parcubacteria group bacterium]|tara:strand:- start:1400 stop:2437 length:1038 start_codon:yes stop_codon:yes gene_type:complete
MNNFIRNKNMLNEVLIVDGLPGCGKTLFTSIFSSLKRIEIQQYSTTLENLCALNYLNKISKDGLVSMIKIELDLLIYETMMSRNTNFRFDDLSGAWKNKLFFKYFLRLFSKGNEEMPKLIQDKKPILHLSTHNLLAFSSPIFEAIGNKLKFIEIVRHPLYMIIQQSINHKKWSLEKNLERQFHLMINSQEGSQPYYFNEIKINFDKLNPTERAIYEMHYHYEKTAKFRNKFRNKNLLTIPFELFVINPQPWLEKILEFLNTSFGKKTNKVLKNQKIPRKFFADGISLEAYKKCGWEPAHGNLSEMEELNLRKKYVIQNNVSKEALNLLELISAKYEKIYNIHNIN